MATNSLLERLENVRDADEFEHEQYQQDDPEYLECATGTGRHLADSLVERLELTVRQCGDTLFRGDRIHPEPLQLVANLLLCEYGTDALDLCRSLLKLNCGLGADNLAGGGLDGAQGYQACGEQ
jgi:hypothetical protein